jgi:hypothetical protein
MPPGLALNEAMLSFATTRGMSAATADDEFQFFTNYHTAKATLSANWEANWRTWVLRHFKFKAEKAAERPPGRDPDWEGIV